MSAESKGLQAWRPRGGAGRALALLVAALLALAHHSLVVQPHVHLPHGEATQAHALHSGQAHRPANAPAPLDCPSCRQLAHAVDHILPPRFAWAERPAAPGWLAPLPPPPPALRGRSHAWHSRGPPAYAA